MSSKAARKPCSQKECPSVMGVSLWHGARWELNTYVT